jgi:DNA glycosylase AlkZ-like
VRRITVTERRRWLGWRHGLATGARSTTATDAARRILALHATDPGSVYLQVRARTEDVSPADVTDALYRDKSLVRLLAMRRTLFVVPVELAPVVQHGAGDQVAVRLRRDLVKRLAADPEHPATQSGDADGWLSDLADSVEAILDAEGPLAGAQLSAREPRLRSQLMYAQGKSYGGPAAITSPTLSWLSAAGRIIRGHAGANWGSSRYEWWTPKRFLPPDGITPMPAEEAQRELVRLWLATFGPATVEDIAWWTGWSLRDARAALSGVDTVAVDLEDEEKPGLLLAEDADAEIPEFEPWVRFLPSLDPTPMGYQRRAFYLSARARSELFDTMGNVGPSVWLDGRIIGGWAQRADGEVAFELFEDVGADVVAMATAEADRVTAWHDGVTVSPRFPTPLLRRLRA